MFLYPRRRSPDKSSNHAWSRDTECNSGAEKSAREAITKRADPNSGVTVISGIEGSAAKGSKESVQPGGLKTPRLFSGVNLPCAEATIGSYVVASASARRISFEGCHAPRITTKARPRSAVSRIALPRSSTPRSGDSTKQCPLPLLSACACGATAYEQGPSDAVFHSVVIESMIVLACTKSDDVLDRSIKQSNSTLRSGS
jgi:hypothetical protein